MRRGSPVIPGFIKTLPAEVKLMTSSTVVQTLSVENVDCSHECLADFVLNLFLG